MDDQGGAKGAPGSAVEKVFPHSVYVPYDRNIPLYHCSAKPFAVPWEYTGWRDETMSWKETCYLHGNLKVSRFPYLSENRNQDVDVSQIPDGRKGAALDS